MPGKLEIVDISSEVESPFVLVAVEQEVVSSDVVDLGAEVANMSVGESIIAKKRRGGLHSESPQSKRLLSSFAATEGEALE